LEMLLGGDYGEISPQQKEVLNEMYGMSQRMSDLINSLLNISRIELGVFVIEPVEVNFSELCEHVINEMEPKLVKKKHQMIKDFDRNLSGIQADPKLLAIIYQNLISNAVKYTRDNGRVVISIKKANDEIVISVANNGEPILPEDRSKIFTKFFRASSAQMQDPDGNGLGLYIVKKIVENGGGRVWFTSEPGSDTTFYIAFPLPGMRPKKGTKPLS